LQVQNTWPVIRDARAATAAGATIPAGATAAGATISNIFTAGDVTAVAAIGGTGARALTVARNAATVTTNVNMCAMPPNVVHEGWPPRLHDHVVHDAHGLGREDEVSHAVVARGVESHLE